MKSTGQYVMNICETIKNIQASCENYADPDLVATIINDNCTLGPANISHIEGYGIRPDDSFEEKVLKILKEKRVFLNFGMISFLPILNECDIYSAEDVTIEMTQDEFDANADKKEGFFGILIEKNSHDYIIGIIDLCSCEIGSGFRKIRKGNGEFYEKIAEIIEKRIIS